MQKLYLPAHGYCALPPRLFLCRKAPKSEQVEALCQSADLIVLRSQVTEWPANCAGVNRITASDSERLGAMELTRSGLKSWHIQAAKPLRGQRPWVH